MAAEIVAIRDPNEMMEELAREWKALEKQRDEAKRRAAAPYDEKIQALKYRYNVLGHRYFGYRHPDVEYQHPYVDEEADDGR